MAVHRREGSWAPPVCLAAFAAVALLLAMTLTYPRPDELEHVSYAAFLQETGRWLPQFEAQRTLSIEDMGRWQDRANYLGHPSPFYLYESMFLDRSLPPMRAVLLPRLASGALVLLGVAAVMAAGRRHFARDRLALWVFCTAVALCPKLLAVAGQVTNDSLAFLGGGVAYWGVSVPLGRWWRRAAVALGLVLALWAKPNAGLAVGVWLAVFAARFGVAGLRLVPEMVAGSVVGAVPYWFIVRSYGALVPVTVEQFGNVRSLAGFGSYVPAFLIGLGSNWAFEASGAWPPTVAGAVMALLFWAMMACAGLGGVSAWSERTVSGAIAVAGPTAFALVLPVHFWFSATKLGFSLPAASFRYYLPLWPALAHALAHRVAVESGWRRGAIVAVVAVAIGVGWVE